MPSDGNGGWCTNWYNGGLGGPPEWETFHIDQLIPWVDASYRTIAARSGRAIAGVSTGGFCAMSYAARYPDMFVWAGSFSGAVNIVNTLAVVAVIAAEAIADGGGPLSVFGSPVTNQIVWQAGNPVNLAANLQSMDLYLATGNGQPGPLDPPGTGINLVWNYYGPGTHTWPYWQRDLTQALPLILATFANPPHHPPSPTPRPRQATQSTDGRWPCSRRSWHGQPCRCQSRAVLGLPAREWPTSSRLPTTSRDLCTACCARPASRPA